MLTGLFIGAGFSREAGMPLVSELTSEIKSWLTPDKLRALNSGWRAQGRGWSDEAIEDLANILQMGELHYENILGYLEVQIKRQSLSGKILLAQEYSGLYSWMVELVYWLLYYRQVGNDKFFDNHLKFYEGIRTLVDQSLPLWVFSLNHDLIVEAIAAKFSIPIHNGFKGSVTFPRRNATGKKIGEICAEVLTKQDLENRAMFFPKSPERGINLLKLHGALDIFTFNNGEDLLKLRPDGGSVAAVFATLRAANEDLIYLEPGLPGGKARTINEITYADNEGIMQFLRRSLLAGAHKFDDHHPQTLPKSMLKHFRDNLNFVTKLVCIGYGFGDQHVNKILGDWLRYSASRHLEIVAPGIAVIPDFLRHMAPQVSLMNKGATDYLDAIAGINRPHSEQIEKEVVGSLQQLGNQQSAKVMSQFLEAEFSQLYSELIERFKSLLLKSDRSPDSVIMEDAQALVRDLIGEVGASREGGGWRDSLRS